MKRITSFCLAVIVLFVTATFGKGLAANTEGNAREETVQLEEIVVTATKTSEKRKDIPNAVIIKDSQDIQASGAKTIGELLANEPGIDWQSYGNYGGAPQEIQIRGMQGKATQVFINGINVNSPSLGTADVGKIPLNSIERIEVVKGSGSLLYGSGAMGGTINIVTKGPVRDKMDLKVETGYGSQNTYQVSAEQGMFVVGDLGYYLTAGRKETDGYRDNSYLRQNDASVKVVLDKGEMLDVSVYGSIIDRSYGMPGVKPPAGTQDYYLNGVKFYNSESATLLNNSQDKDGQAVVEVKGKPSKWLGYDLKGYYTKMVNYNYERYAFDGSGNENWVTNQVRGTDGHLEFRPIEGGSVLLGGEYKDFDWKNEAISLNTDGSPVTGIKTETQAHIFTQGTFGELQYRPSKYIKALAGLRHEDHSTFGSENLPLFGLVINPFPTTALKFNHGKHFQAPTPNDLYWPADPYTKGNPDLKPEIGWHTDVTAEQSLLDNKVFMTMSYFHWNVDNKIQWEPDSNGVWSPLNLASYKADGIEAGVKVGPFYDLTMSLSYTYLNAEEESRQYTRQDYGWPPFIPADFQYNMVTRRATMTPDRLFKGDITYRSDLGLTVSATVRYVGDRVMYNTETTTYPDTRTVMYTLDSYWTVDMKVQQRLCKHWLLSLSGSNLLDKAYDTHLTTFTDQATSKTTMSGYPGAGRSVFFSIAYEY